MAKNILIILDNGRVHGNTQQLAEAFARGAEAAGHNVKTISLRKRRSTDVSAAMPAVTASHVSRRTISTTSFPI